MSAAPTPRPPDRDQPVATDIDRRRVVFATVVGTTVEWYDFFIYATAAGLVFGTLFFQPAGPGVGTILSFLTVGISFLFRPLGAFLAGHYGDKYGISPPELLATYSAERQVIAQNLIDFDREWSAMMAKKPEDFSSPSELEDFYVKTIEFPAGFMTQYQPSMIIGTDNQQELAGGFPIGKRFKSAPVARVADGNPVQLGHHHRADGRWRIYAFAPDGQDAVLDGWADWLENSSDSPVTTFTPKDADIDSLFDVKVIYRRPHPEVDLGTVPSIFLPKVGPFQVIDYEKVYALDPTVNIFTERSIDPQGAVVVVRPDQYVAQVLPLTGTRELADFFASIMQVREAEQPATESV